MSHSFEISANAGRTPASPVGPLALPGMYTLRITANGITRSTGVTVRNDPRARVTPAALIAQHALQMQIVDGMRHSHTGQRQVSTLRALLARASVDVPADVATATGMLRAAIDAAVGADAAGTHAGKFRELNELFTALLNAQETADHAPNAAMRAAFAEASRRLAATQRAWSRVLERDLAALNAVRTQRGLGSLQVPEP